MLINLIVPPYPGQMFKGESKPLSPIRGNIPKSSLLALAAEVRRAITDFKVEFRFIDMQIDKRMQLYKTIEYGDELLCCYRIGAAFEDLNEKIIDADVNVISNNFTNSAGIVSDLMRYIRSISSSSKIIVGGIDVSARLDFYIKAGADYIVEGEGEIAFTEIIRTIQSGKHAFTKSEAISIGNTTIVKALEPFDMSSILPIAVDLIPDKEVYNDTGEGKTPYHLSPPYICFETSRGCYRGCSFCATPSRGKYSYMPQELIIQHLQYYRSQGIRNLLIQEDNLLSRIQRDSKGSYLHPFGRSDLLNVFENMREMGFLWEFANGVEFGKFLDTGSIDTELIEHLFWNEAKPQRKGCYRVQLSLEDLSTTRNKKLKKLRTRDEEIKIVKAINDVGIDLITFNVIIGHDDDDIQMVNEYINNCLELKQELLTYNPNIIPYFNVYIRSLLPGSKDFKVNSDVLHFNIDKDPEVISLFLSGYNTKKLTFYDLVKLRTEFTRRVNGDMVERYDGVYY